MPVHEAELAVEVPPPPAGGDPTVVGHAPSSSFSRSLYAGDLQPDVTEDQLSAIFAPVGGLLSVRICRDAATRASLGYAYVNFLSSKDAICALETLNHTVVNGKPIRIMWSHRDSDVRKSGIGNLFVKNLAESIDNLRLQEIFSKFGKILSCKVVTSTEGKSKCHGYVQFDTQESANAALEELHEAYIEGKQIFVSNFIKRSERVVPTSDAEYTNLYVKNLDQDITEELLHLKFSEFGKITSLAIAADSHGNSKGFGFVNFESPGSAKTAAETMNGMQLGSKALYVARAQKKSEREKILGRLYGGGGAHNDTAKNMASNVYVKNIHDSVSDDDLRKHFSVCGTITSARVMRDEKGVSRGFGFVCFSSADEANRAVGSLHGFMFRGKPLYVAIAQRKEDRQTHLRLQYARMASGLAGPSSGAVHAGHAPIYSPPAGRSSQIPLQHNLIYQPVGTRPGWMPNGFLPPTKLGFQAWSPQMNPTVARHHWRGRGQINGNVLCMSGLPSSYVPQVQPSWSVNLGKESGSRQWGPEEDKVPNHQMHDLVNGLAVPTSAASKSQGMDLLRSMLASASPQQQKQMVGEHLFPLVQKQKPDLAAKITGMLLEMENRELLLLLESPHSLATKVDEAAQVLKISKAKSGKDDLEQSRCSRSFFEPSAN